MRLAGILAGLVISLFIGADSTRADTRTRDPVSYSLQLLDILEKDGADVLKDILAKDLDSTDVASELRPVLTSLQKQKAKFRAVALDRDYGGAVRQIVVYHYMLANYPFVYFRFVYKMTDTGWRMVHISVNSENSQPFPPKYGID
jgi:hypothetical protein